MPTRNLWCLLLVLFITAFMSPAHAEDVAQSGYSETQLGLIREAQIKVAENRAAAAEGDATQAGADARIKKILNGLNASLPGALTENSLMQITTPTIAPKQSSFERKQGFFEGASYLRLLLISVFSILSFLLIGKYVLQILTHFPKELWEVAAYGSGIYLLVAQGTGIMSTSQLWAFFGCLLIGGGLAISALIHFDDKSSNNNGTKKFYLQYVCPTVMLIAFAAATLITTSSWMGAFAALALMALLGFMADIIPFGYVIGFKDETALARATSAGLIIVAAFMALHVLNLSPPHVMAFETGALVVGGFVGYLGLLIVGTHWYPNRQNWLLMQVIVLILCFAGVISASIFGLKSIQIIAGVFLGLWTIEKMLEIPGVGFVPWLLKGMAASGALYLIVTYGTPLYAHHFIH